MKIDNFEVKDAATERVIEITKQDVKFGKRRDANTCAASQAICRQIEGARAARVQVARAYVLIKNKWVRYKTSPALRTEVISFDRGGSFQPGTYTLVPAPPSMRLDSPTPKKAERTNEPSKPRRKYHQVKGVRARLEADWE